MKNMLFLFIVFPVAVFAQKNKNKEVLVGINNDSLGKFISLPDLNRSDFYKIYEAGRS
jgi:hypothetical protein